MADVAFYHLERSSLDQVLPKLLEKTLALDKRALVLAPSSARIDELNTLLWTYDAESWMPHASLKDKVEDDVLSLQSVWLSVEDNNANNAEFLFLIDGARARQMDSFERCFDVFDGNDQAVVEKARERWKRYSEEGHNLTYWQQDLNGVWQKKQ